jgi:hypothetical protein
MAIVSEGEDEDSEDFRNAIVGVPCMVGGSFVGLGKYVGIKNRYIILIADEASLMSDAYGRGVTSLEQNPGFRCWPLANPKDRFDTFGKLVEPADSEGGWAVTEDITKTTVWKTRKDRGVCVNLVGTDSPNHDEPRNRFAKWMPSVEDVDASLAYYGKDSAQALMFVLGVFPKDAQSRRVLTPALCRKFCAQDDVVWQGEPQFKVVGVDAAYGAVGGDRTPLTELHVGVCHDGKQRVAIANGPVMIPVKASLPDLPEDQIALYVMKYCEERGIPPGNVFFDSTGRGSLVSSFGRLWSTAVNGVEFGGVASDRPVHNKPVGPNQQQAPKTCREQYVDFVTELWFLAQVLVEGDQMRQLPTAVMEEGVARAWDFQASIGRVKIYVESKVDMKLRFSRSPDLFDSLVAGLEGCRRLGLEIGGSPKRAVDLRDMMKEFAEERRQGILARELVY